MQRAFFVVKSKDNTFWGLFNDAKFDFFSRVKYFKLRKKLLPYLKYYFDFTLRSSHCNITYALPQHLFLSVGISNGN